MRAQSLHVHHQSTPEVRIFVAVAPRIGQHARVPKAVVERGVNVAVDPKPSPGRFDEPALPGYKGGTGEAVSVPRVYRSGRRGMVR